MECFTVLHKGGAVLWKKELSPIKGNPINELIKTVLLEERSGESVFKHDNYQMKWRLVNEFDLVFVVVYAGAVTLMLVDELLESLKAAFLKLFKDAITALPAPSQTYEFDSDFQRVMQRHEQKVLEWRNRGQKTFDDTALAKDIRNPNAIKKEEPKKAGKTSAKPLSKKDVDEEDGDADEDEASPAPGEMPGSPESPGGPLAGGGKGGARVQRGFVKKEKEKKKGDELAVGAAAAADKKKAQRSWDGLAAAAPSKGELNALDRCTDRPQDAVAETLQERAQYVGTGKADVDNWGIESDEEEEAKPSKSKAKGMWDTLKLLAGGSRELTQEDLEPVLEQFKDLLISKNVAAECAQKLCASVGSSLHGKTVSGYNGVKNEVKAAIEDGLLRILTPKQDMDIIRQVKAAQTKGKPYVIVFVGVNGVGKSTSLSKVCFWLKSQKFKVMLAACDTFRSGAVEQLKTHASRLDVPVFEKGYNKDAASIAMEAVKYAGQTGFDVVLVDTAGRMQDNEPLMRSLSKLVNMNNPDLVLFVGEALVGNDSIDQVTKFNKALQETAFGTSSPRLIDGIMLTKFDTIDDKVGAAVSMVYVTGQPVVLVGVGQTYTDLKKLNAHNIVKLLLR